MAIPGYLALHSETTPSAPVALDLCDQPLPMSALRRLSVERLEISASVGYFCCRLYFYDGRFIHRGYRTNHVQVAAILL